MSVEVNRDQEQRSNPDVGASPYGSPSQGARDPGPVTDGEARGEAVAGVTQPSRRGSSSRFLTDVIADMALATRDQVDQAIEASRNEGTTPERVLLARGAITADGLARALAERYGLDHLDLDVFPVDMGAANLVVNTAAKRYQAVPVSFVDKRTLLLAMADPSNVLAVDDVAIMTGYEVRVAVASPDAIGELISRMARLDDVVSGEAAIEESEDSSAEIVNLRETADDAPVVKLVNQIVAQAVELGLRRSPRARRQRGAREGARRRHPPGHNDCPTADGRRVLSRA